MEPLTPRAVIEEPLPDPPCQRTNYPRRGVGVAVCFAPVALLVASGAYGLIGGSGNSRGVPLATLGLLVGVLNVHLSFVRPLFLKWRYGSLEGHSNPSGLPLFGTLFVTLAGLLSFGHVPTAVVGLVTLAIDTGGLPWVPVVTWRDRGFWDD